MRQIQDSNFKDDILAAAKGEPIEAISVGRKRSGWSLDDTPDHALGDGPVSWDMAAPVLDYAYDAGFGGQDCHNIWAWTRTRVLSIHEYDGSTSIISVPRNPAPYKDGWDD
jgi:hypothetical protein